MKVDRLNKSLQFYIKMIDKNSSILILDVTTRFCINCLEISHLL